MNKIDIDITSSTAARCSLPSRVSVSPYVIVQEGYCVAARVLEDKKVYNQLEDANGVFHTLRAGQTIVGVLGERRALKGYSGRLPRLVRQGDVLNVLNLGGIIGQCTSEHPDVGPALRVEVLGAVMTRKGEILRHACIRDGALEPVETLMYSAPLVVVSGSAMHTGKTLAACGIIRGLAERGMQVAAAKLTGAALLRDVKKMEAHGAGTTATFVDAGVVASTSTAMTPVAKAIVAHLNEERPDVIVLELGDGFVGYYGVDELLRDRELQHFTKAHVVTASDLAGAWAADRLFRQSFCAPITAMTGPVTDNEVGCRYLQQVLGVTAINARQNPSALTSRVAEALESPADPAPQSSPFISIAATS